MGKTGSVFVLLLLGACATPTDKTAGVEFAARTGAQLWVNHDMEQHARIPKAPQSVQ